jgi:hypothetical protein
MPRQKIKPSPDALKKLDKFKPKPVQTGDTVLDAFYNTFWITPAIAAASMGMSVKTLQRLKLPGIEVGGRIRYSYDILYNYVVQHNPHLIQKQGE